MKQPYRTELLYCTLVSIKPEISQALQSLLDEIGATEDAKVIRTAASSYHRPTQVAKPTTRFRTRPKSCPLCKQAGRGEFHHYLSECTYQRQIMGILDCDEFHPRKNQRTTNLRPLVSSLSPPPPSALRIQVRQFPYLDTFYRHNPVRITIDSGATGNMIRLSTVQKLNVEICKSAQSAFQTNESSPLKLIGETKLSSTIGQTWM